MALSLLWPLALLGACSAAIGRYRSLDVTGAVWAWRSATAEDRSWALSRLHGYGSGSGYGSGYGSGDGYGYGSGSGSGYGYGYGDGYGDGYGSGYGYGSGSGSGSGYGYGYGDGYGDGYGYGSGYGILWIETHDGERWDRDRCLALLASVAGDTNSGGER